MISTNSTETPPRGGESVSGQTSGLNTGEYSTLAPDSQLTTLQHRIGHIRLKARIPGACIALEVPGPVKAVLLTIEEARQLIGALASLIGDIEDDARARDWSRQKLMQIIQAANGSAESYDSRL